MQAKSDRFEIGGKEPGYEKSGRAGPLSSTMQKDAFYMMRRVPAQARVSANASALTPSAAARPNVRSTMVMELLLQILFLYCMCELICRYMLRLRNRNIRFIRKFKSSTLACVFCNPRSDGSHLLSAALSHLDTRRLCY